MTVYTHQSRSRWQQLVLRHLLKPTVNELMQRLPFCTEFKIFLQIFIKLTSKITFYKHKKAREKLENSKLEYEYISYAYDNW